jgi:hypothetical protein
MLVRRVRRAAGLADIGTMGTAALQRAEARTVAPRRKVVRLPPLTIKGRVPKVATAPAAPSAPPATPWHRRPETWIVAGIAAAGLYFATRGGARVSNPGSSRRQRDIWHPDPEVRKAIAFRREFHWGYGARGLKRMNVSPAPRAGVQLGEVAEITYRTRKKGEVAQLFCHEFEGPRPRLVMDVRNKRLHLVGGGYTVTADGITG